MAWAQYCFFDLNAWLAAGLGGILQKWIRLFLGDAIKMPLHYSSVASGFLNHHLCGAIWHPLPHSVWTSWCITDALARWLARELCLSTRLESL